MHLKGGHARAKARGLALLAAHRRLIPDAIGTKAIDAMTVAIQSNKRMFKLLLILLYNYNIHVAMSPGNTKQENRPIYNRLAVLRAERGLSRQALAGAVDMNSQTIGYL